jgi:Ran GTPase-activating protein (RanGAP) involved in mRNA processing and transport
MAIFKSINEDFPKGDNKNHNSPELSPSKSSRLEVLARRLIADTMTYEEMDLTPKSCLVVRNDTGATDLENYQMQYAPLQSEIEHIFLMGVDLSESSRKVQLLESIFHTRTTKWRAVTFDRCWGPVDVLLSTLLLKSEAPIENLTLNSLFVSLPIARALLKGLQRKGRGIQKISFCGCRWTTESMALCLQGLEKNDSIHTVRFNGAIFCDPDVSMAFANAIGRCHQIRRLELFSCMLSDVCAASLVASLHQMPKLEYLDLGRNACGSQCLEALGKLLERTSSLHTLNLALLECSTIHPLASLDLQLLASGFQNNCTLRSLFLRGNRLDDQAVDALIEMLIQENCSIERLMLTDCGISSERIDSLLENLENMTELRVLWLDGIQDIRISSRKRLQETTLKSLQYNNTSLEVLKFPFGSIDSTSAIQHLLDLNRGGRRLVLDGKTRHRNTAKFIPSYWPLVLERVNRFQFDASPGISPTSRELDRVHGDDIYKERKANIIYFFLRQKILVET